MGASTGKAAVYVKLGQDLFGRINSFMLQLVIILKALTKVTLLALLGQDVLFILAGPTRDKNIFYHVIALIKHNNASLTE